MPIAILASHNQNAAANLRDTIASTRTAMANLAADTEAIKHNFFCVDFSTGVDIST
jgi:hypothetical protein